MQLWKKCTVNRRSLAAPFSIGISSSHNDGPLHHQSQRVEDWWRPPPRQRNMIGTMLVDDDSLSQWYIALIGISRTALKSIILSLFFPAVFIGVHAYAFMRNVRTSVLFALSGWFFHRWCNILWAICCFFYFFNLRCSRLVMGFVSLLKTQPLYFCVFLYETYFDDSSQSLILFSSSMIRRSRSAIFSARISWLCNAPNNLTINVVLPSNITWHHK